jgi:serine protease Do
MASITNFGSTLWNKARSGHMPTTFALLGALTVGIVAGSAFTGSVSAHQQKVDSSDARQLTIPDPKTLGNGFSAIVKQVGPAVVNINTESLPKQSAVPKARRRGTPVPTPDPDGGDGADGNNMQDFFNHFFGGNPNGGGVAPRVRV